MVGDRPTGYFSNAISRRRMLAAGAALGVGIITAGGDARAHTHPVARIVALDAPVTEMLLAVGVEPAGVAGLGAYRAAQGELPGLEQAVDIGFYYEPNLELLQALAPDLFISSFGIGAPPALLERIAPLVSLPIYGGNNSSYGAAIAALSRIGQIAGREPQAAAFIDGHEQRLVGLRKKTSKRVLRSLYLATPLLDGRHVILYGANSLFEAVLDRAGIRNAFSGPTSPWGIATVGLEELATTRDAVFVYIESPVTRTALSALRSSPIWKMLPFARPERTASVPYLEMYGALPTADRFAQFLGTLIGEGILDVG